MKFSEIQGHKEIKKSLAGNVDSGRVSHAIMLSGRTGYGTLALALGYVQYLYCNNRQNGDSCGTCPACLKVSGLVHPDLHFVFPVISGKSGSKTVSDNFAEQWRDIFLARNGYFNEQQWYEQIGAERQQGLISRAEADEVIRKLSFKSFEADYKTMIIWLPEKMRTEAANALLKILEEPWDRTLFILVTENQETLLPTIRSRVQTIEIGPLVKEDVIEYLTANGEDRETALKIAESSQGDLTEARSGLEGVGSDSGFLELFVNLMRYCYGNKHLELIDWAENFVSLNRERQKSFLDYSTNLLRNSFMLNRGLDEIVTLKQEEIDFCRKFSPFINSENIEGLRDEFEKVKFQLLRNGNARIVMTHFVLLISKYIKK